MAYALSALAAVLYLVAAVALAHPGPRGRRVAARICALELMGVLGVGVLDAVRPGLFPDAAVWSGFGSGYGYLPLALPLLGPAWLAATRPATTTPRLVASPVDGLPR